MTRDANNLTPEQLKVVTWLATPVEDRDLKTQGELADEIGVKTATISRWRERLDLDDWAAHEVRKGLFLHFPEVCEVLAERAKSGSYPHMKLFLETTSGYGVSEDGSAR